MLCQLSYSHRQVYYSNCGSGMSETLRTYRFPSLDGDRSKNEATLHGVNQMSERGVGQTEESRRKAIENSREEKQNTASALRTALRHLAHGSWGESQKLMPVRQRTRIPWRGAG